MDVLKYLQDSLSRGLQEEGFEYNKNDEANQHFIRYSIEVHIFFETYYKFLRSSKTFAIWRYPILKFFLIKSFHQKFYLNKITQMSIFFSH